MNGKSYDKTDFGLPTKEDKELINKHNQVLRNETGQKLKKRRGSYKNHAVQERISWFIEELDVNVGLTEPDGKPRHFNKKELKFWIQRLGLAFDRLTVNQYLKRFLMFGYMSVSSRSGTFYFVSKTPQEVTANELVNTKQVMLSIRALTREQKKRRSY